MINISIQEAVNGYVVMIHNWNEKTHKTEITERYCSALGIINSWLEAEIKLESKRLQGLV